MRQLDSEMEKRDIKCIVVFGDTTLANPDLEYVVGGALPRGGVYFKRRGHAPLLVTSNLDIGLAQKYGKIKRIETFTKWGLEKLYAKYGRADAFPRLIASVLKYEGVAGKVAVLGRTDLGAGLYTIDRLRRWGIQMVGDKPPTILDRVREVKSRSEIEQLRQVAHQTSGVVQVVIDVLRNMKKRRGRFRLEGKTATVGRVKKRISIELAARNLVAPEGTIFANGSTSAEGHNAGVASQRIREGELIVFDIFPQNESGYWSDITRSFVIGRANAKQRHMYEAVHDAQSVSLDFLKAGVTGEAAMATACDVIERHGYRTLRDIYEGKAKEVKSGFNHSLGHGVGLSIGERPYLGFLNKDPLKRGNVVTVEPGVYIPGYGGVRIEDTVAITSRGIDNLVTLEKEFELT